MTTILLKFKLEDFKSNYFNYKDCAVTRALHRAGYDYLYEGGGCIINLNGSVEVESSDINGFGRMYRKVHKMYLTKDSDRKKFQATIKLDLSQFKNLD